MSAVPMLKRGGGLVPASDAAAEALRTIAEGREILVEIKTPRNVRHHRMAFACLQVLVEAERFPTVEAALIAVKIALGHVDPIIDPTTGRVVYALKSISFASMPQADFRNFFDAMVTLAAERWLGVDADDLRQRVYEITDGAAASALGRRVA